MNIDIIQQDSQEEEVCRGCGFRGSRLIQHLQMTKKNCKTFYDMEEVKRSKKQGQAAQLSSDKRQEEVTFTKITS